jgi:hypothetical protein
LLVVLHVNLKPKGFKDHLMNHEKSKTQGFDKYDDHPKNVDCILPGYYIAVTLPVPADEGINYQHIDTSKCSFLTKVRI